MKNKLGQQCTAKSKQSGVRCKKAARPGGNVCHIHGGKAPQVERQNARKIIELLVGPALVQLRQLIENPTISPNVKLGAIRDVLDRAGFKPADVVEVTHITEDVLDREIARLSEQLAELDE